MYPVWREMGNSLILRQCAPQALTRYGKLTWESAHAWNLIILCSLIAWGMTFYIYGAFEFYAIHKIA